ncbi:MAG: M23 family metallopeptidase [Actinomycetes bacterium]
MRLPRLSNRSALVCARLRLPGTGVGLAMMAIALAGVGGLVWPALVVLVVAMAMYARVGTVRRDPVEIACPVQGWWMPVHSPADKVPSHGLHAYGQTYAIDLVGDPPDGSRPGFSWWPLARRPEEFPGFGLPVLAVADGVVVRRHDRERDHWSRTSWPSLVLLVLEGVRELFGVGRILGNHLVIDHGDGVFSAYAHLRSGTVSVAVGEAVHAGDRLAECGNSGNSSEPHLHLQLMDHPSAYVAAGLPFTFRRIEQDGTVGPGVPRNGRRFQGLGQGQSQGQGQGQGLGQGLAQAPADASMGVEGGI